MGRVIDELASRLSSFPGVARGVLDVVVAHLRRGERIRAVLVVHDEVGPGDTDGGEGHGVGDGCGPLSPGQRAVGLRP